MSNPNDNTPVRLYPRDQEVCGFVSRGLSNKEIAAAMGITEGTVKAYVARIFQRTGIDNRVKLAL